MRQRQYLILSEGRCNAVINSIFLTFACFGGAVVQQRFLGWIRHRWMKIQWRSQDAMGLNQETLGCRMLRT